MAGIRSGSVVCPEVDFTFLSFKVSTAHSPSMDEIKSTHLVCLTTTAPSCTIRLTLSLRMASQLYERLILWMEKHLTRPLAHLMLNKPTRCTVALQRKESEDRLVNISFFPYLQRRISEKENRSIFFLFYFDIIVFIDCAHFSVRLL